MNADRLFEADYRANLNAKHCLRLGEIVRPQTALQFEKAKRHSILLSTDDEVGSLSVASFVANPLKMYVDYYSRHKFRRSDGNEVTFHYKMGDENKWRVSGWTKSGDVGTHKNYISREPEDKNGMLMSFNLVDEMRAFSDMLIARGFSGEMYEELMIAGSQISVRKNNETIKKPEEYFYSDVLGGCNRGL